MSIPRLRVLLAAAVAALCLGLVACSDDEGPATTDATAEQEGDAGQEGDSKRVVIEAQDGAFDSQQIYEAAAPGVVTVISVFGSGGDTPGIFGGPGGGGGGQGSGFVISEQGEIVTNAHVVTDAASAGVQTADLNQARQVFVQFSDRNQVEAEIVGFDPYADIALLQIEPDGLDLNPIPLGSENDVEVGDGVAAIGSPFGQEQSLSVGIVSASDRSIESLTRFRIEGAIQTDASINPGNSGGPLLDAAGEVVGINQQIQTSSGGNEGVGFAVPIDLAERSIEQLREDGDVDYAYVGVETRELYPQLADELGLDVDTGALVAEVIPGGPADEAGLQAGNEPLRFQGFSFRVGGDVITAIDGEEIVSGNDLPRLVSLMDPGDTVTLEIIRDGERREVEIELGSREDA